LHMYVHSMLITDHRHAHASYDAARRKFTYMFEIREPLLDP